MSKHWVFIAAIAFFITVLGGFIYMQERVVVLGDEVILATRPIDPRDLFRGEYVILRYAIETNETVQNTLGEGLVTDTLYVRLGVDESGVADVVEVSIKTPDFSTGTWLRGDVDQRRVRFPDLEQYFLPEGAGKPIEDLGTDLHVRVRIYKGEARVVGLLDADLQGVDVYEYRDAKIE